MSEKGDWTREPGFRSGSVYAGAGPTSETSDPPRGVLYEDGTASEALRSGSGRAGDRGEPSDAVVVGVMERDDGREYLDMGVGSRGDMTLTGCEGGVDDGG